MRKISFGSMQKRTLKSTFANTEIGDLIVKLLQKSIVGER